MKFEFLLLILCECEWNMVWRSYVITQVYISFWSDFMTSVSVKNWYDLRFNMTFDAIQLRLIWSYCEHFYGGTGPMPMAFYGPVTCKNYDYPWGTWNCNSYESFWRSWTCKHYWSSWGTWNIVIILNMDFGPLGGTAPMPMIFVFLFILNMDSGPLGGTVPMPMISFYT